MSSKSLITSPVLRFSGAGDAQALADLEYDAGFKLIKRLAGKYIEDRKDYLVRDQNMKAEDAMSILAEIRVLKGICDMPDVIKSKKFEDS